MSAPKTLTEQIDTAITVGEKFVKLYYEHLDKMRHKLKKLYHDNGILLWNGHHEVGPDKIQVFFQDLPTSYHTVYTIDAQPISGSAVNDQSSILVTTSGFVNFDSRKNIFQQTFIITVDGENWKIVSDTFRFQACS